MKKLRLLTWAVIVFLWAPLLIVVWKGLSITAFQALFENRDILQSFRNSLLLALLSSVSATAMGLCTSFALPLLGKRFQQFILTSILTPLVLPEIAFGISYFVLYQSLGLSLGWTTLLLSHIGFTFSYTVLILSHSVARVDFSLADAARDLGAPPLLVFRHAILPQLIPGLIASTVISFSLSLDDFLVTFFVKGIDQITLPIKIFSMIRLRIGPEIYALSVVLFGISFLSVVITQVWLNGSQKR